MPYCLHGIPLCHIVFMAYPHAILSSWHTLMTYCLHDIPSCHIVFMAYPYAILLFMAYPHAMAYPCAILSSWHTLMPYSLHMAYPYVILSSWHTLMPYCLHMAYPYAHPPHARAKKRRCRAVYGHARYCVCVSASGTTEGWKESLNLLLRPTKYMEHTHSFQR